MHFECWSDYCVTVALQYCVLTVVQISNVKLYLFTGTSVTMAIAIVVIRVATIVAVSVRIGWRTAIVRGLVGIIVSHS